MSTDTRICVLFKESNFGICSPSCCTKPIWFEMVWRRVWWQIFTLWVNYVFNAHLYWHVLYWHEIYRSFSSFFFTCPGPTEQPTFLSLTLNFLSSFSIISLSSLFIYIVPHCMLFSNYRLSKSIWKCLFIIERRAHIEFTKCIPNSYLIYISLSFRQRDDWDVLWLPSVSTLENPAALKTPRLWRSLVTLCGSVCSIAGRTSHCKTPFHQLSFWSTGGRGVEMVTATSLPSLRLEYCLF